MAPPSARSRPADRYSSRRARLHRGGLSRDSRRGCWTTLQEAAETCWASCASAGRAGARVPSSPRVDLREVLTSSAFRTHLSHRVTRASRRDGDYFYHGRVDSQVKFAATGSNWKRSKSALRTGGRARGRLRRAGWRVETRLSCLRVPADGLRPPAERSLERCQAAFRPAGLYGPRPVRNSSGICRPKQWAGN